MNIEDPLKPFEKIFEKDREFIDWNIDTLHSELSKIKLNVSVPIEIVQLFETAKNISLYSHFAYRLHQPAELYGFIAFEKAFREKAKELAPDLFEKYKYLSLAKIIDRAIRDKWITEHQFEDALEVAEQRVKDRYIREIIPYFVGTEVTMLEPTEEEINKEYDEMNFVPDMLTASKNIRNLLAHGSNMLSPSSPITLRNISITINALFKEYNI